MVANIKYYVGIDGGGTNSRMLVTDENMNPLLRVVGGSTNLDSNTKEFVLGNFDIMFAELAKNGLRKEDCISLCIGSAGLNSESSCKRMEEMIREAGFSCRASAVNDSLLVLAGAFSGKPGAVLVCGTGSIAYGMDADGNTIRCGGWGHFIDDKGSAYWIGKEAVRRAFFSYDGRGEKTVLESVLKERYEVNVLPECLDRFYGPDALNKTEIAQLSLVVEEHAKQGDAVCLQILSDAADGLAALVSAVLKAMRAHCKSLIVSGGTIENNDILFELLERKLHGVYPGFSIAKIEKEPIWGAIYLASNRNNL